MFSVVDLRFAHPYGHRDPPAILGRTSMSADPALTSWVVSTPDDGQTLARFLKSQLQGRSWRDVKGLVETGKVFVDEAPERNPDRRVGAGQRVTLRMSAPRREAAGRGLRIVHEDAHIVVVD